VLCCVLQLHVLQLSVFSMLGASPLAAHLLLTSLFPLSAIAAGLNDALMPVEPVLLTHLFELLNSLLLSHIWCPPSAGAVVSWPAVQRPPPLAGELFRLASTQQSSANATRGDASANGVDSGANSERGLFVLASLSASTRKHLAFAADRALEVLSYKATMKKRTRASCARRAVLLSPFATPHACATVRRAGLGVDQQLQLPEFSADALNLVQQATQTACHALRQGTAFAAGTSAFHRLVFSCIELLDVAPVIRMGERDPSLVDLDAYFTMLEDVLRLLMVADDVLRRARADGAISAVSRDVTLKSMAFSIMQGIALFGARVRLLPAEVLRGVWESALWADVRAVT
jgi:hypothetical protein